MRRKYPPLTPDEVIRILKARGFAYHHTTGSHEYYLGTIRGATRRVTVDGHYREFSDKLIILTRTRSLRLQAETKRVTILLTRSLHKKQEFHGLGPDD